MDKTTVLQIGGIDVTVTRKRMKNMYLRVQPSDGRVSVSAPLATSDLAIRRFVEARADWVMKHREKALAACAPELENGAQIPFFGTPLELKLLPGKSRAKVERHGDALYLWLDPESEKDVRRRALDAWYRKELMQAARDLLPECEQTVGKRAGELKIRDMKTRWGTCNVKSAVITLNLRLAQKPRACLEYVLIHELCHLHEAGHNERFWQRMDVYYPDWKRVRKLLKNGTQA